MVAARHPVSRALKQSQSTLYICRSCRNQFSRTGVSFQQQRFASNDDLPATEKIRRKLWGTDNPPGLKDPYGGPSFLERRRLQRQAEQASQEDLANLEQSAVLKPKKARVAEEPESVSSPQTKYVPAETWDGLEYVGSNSWHELPVQPEDEFTGWLSSQSYVAANRSELVSCLHQAIVECLTCDQAGLNASTVLSIDSTTFDDSALDAIASANVTKFQDGTLGQVQFSSDAQAKEIVEILATIHRAPTGEQEEMIQDVDPDSDMVDGETQDILPQDEPIQAAPSNISRYIVQDESFLSVRLDIDDTLTFTILKRFSQLAGHRIPDPFINTLFSSRERLSYLVDQLDQLVVRPKPTKVADILMSRPGLSNQPNVMIFPRRETSVDKEKEVGRWKIIEQELKQRGLPVLGKLEV